MKRYTFKSGDDYYVISGEECFDDQDENYSGPAIDKLAKYEDLEETGKLVILPCKIGDIVYQPSYKFTACSACNITPRYKHDMDCEDCCHECDSECYPYIYEGRVCGMGILCMDNEAIIRVRVQFKDKWDASEYVVGKDVFLALEEAEEKLKDKTV